MDSQENGNESLDVVNNQQDQGKDLERMEAAAEAEPSENDNALKDEGAQQTAKNPGNAFASVKKTYHRKGYEEGYQQARQEALREQHVTQSSSQPGTQPGFTRQSPDVMNAAPLMQRAMEIEYKGRKTYDDFDAKTNSLAYEIKTCPDPQKQIDLQTLLNLAVMTPDAEKILYKLADDENLRESLLEKHPRTWGAELARLTRDTAADAKPVVKHTKVASPPLDQLRTPPAKGGGEMTWSERRKAKEALVKYGRRRAR